MADLSGQFLGRYHLIERLGEGGMAVVYRAFDTRLERDVAIKIIRSGAFPTEIWGDVLKRFEREAKSLARLSHPNIVKVHDYGEHEGSPFLVMEYLSGGTLKKKLVKPVPWRDALRLLLPITRGVAYAHQHGVLHRDIKPANILLSEGGEPMLSDFGIAKLFEMGQSTTLTGTGTVIGTPEYMAPEQWIGKTSPQSDLYSLGITLYEMVAGRKPYVADTPAALLIKQATEPLPSPRKFVAELPEAMEGILTKALAKEPENRFQNIDAFIEALENMITSMPVGQPSSEPKRAEETFKVPVERSLVLLPTQVSQPSERKTRLASSEVESQGLKKTLTSLEKTMLKPSFTRFSRKWIGIAIGGIIVLAAALGGIILRNGYVTNATPPESNSAVSITTKVSSPVQIVQSILTDTPSPTFKPTGLSPTETMTPLSAMSTLGIGSTILSKKDSMELVYVPAGEFTMGSDVGAYNHIPAHSVYLDAFWFDKTEITNKMYAICVFEGVCKKPLKTNSITHPTYYGRSEFDDYPVIFVDWSMAKAYCDWAGRRLPTEAEWEKVARGSDKRLYPWGNDPPDNDLLNDDSGDTTPVGKYSKGVSPYGALDMAGNVLEWVADRYSETYYVNSPTSNPLGPDSGSFRVLRSGTWYLYQYFEESGVLIRVGGGAFSAVDRRGNSPTYTNFNLGFRCAMSATP